MGSPPKTLVVHQIRQYRAEGMCLDDTIAAWKVTEKSVQKLYDLSVEPIREPTDGMYYQEGCADFSISPDSKKNIIEWQVGPRYGRGLRYDIVLNDSNVILHKDADLWVS